jgi:hypothetical protein
MKKRNSKGEKEYVANLNFVDPAIRSWGDNFDTWDLDASTEGPAVSLKRRKASFVMGRQSHCEQAIGGLIGTLLGHGGTITRIEPDGFWRQDVNVTVSDPDKGFGHIIVHCTFDKLSEHDCELLANELDDNSYGLCDEFGPADLTRRDETQ